MEKLYFVFNFANKSAFRIPLLSCHTTISLVYLSAASAYMEFDIWTQNLLNTPNFEIFYGVTTKPQVLRERCSYGYYI